MNHTVKAIAALLGLCGCVIVFFMDVNVPQCMAMSDYTSTFYVVAHLVVAGKAGDLYSSAAAGSLERTPYNEAAHRIIKDLPKNALAAYQSPPLLALLLIPLSFLPQSLSLCAFQIISLVCLSWTTQNILSTAVKKNLTRRDVITWTLMSITFLPVLITLAIGQIDIVVGMLPISFGFRYLLGKKPIKAGLALSFCMFKPQFLILALFLAASPVVAKKNKCLIALGFGVTLFLLTNLLFFGPQVLGAWFNCFSVSSELPSLNSAVNMLMMTNLPQSVILMLPKIYVPIYKPYIYIVGSLIALLGFSTALRLTQSKVKEDNKYAGTLILGAFAAPLAMPHFLLYDYSCLYPAALAVIYSHWHHERRWHFRSLLRMTWMIVNAYVITLFVYKQFAIPLILIVFMFFFFRKLLLIVEEVRENDAIKPVPMATY